MFTYAEASFLIKLGDKKILVISQKIRIFDKMKNVNIFWPESQTCSTLSKITCCFYVGFVLANFFLMNLLNTKTY